mgnify:CR=1 FL=1
MKWSEEHGHLLQLLWAQCCFCLAVEPVVTLLTLVSPVAGLRIHTASDPRLGVGNPLAPAADASTLVLAPVANPTS